MHTLSKQLTFHRMLRFETCEARLVLACSVFLDADTPATGSDLDTTPLVTPCGTISATGTVEIITSTGDSDLVAAGATGDGFDIFGSLATAQMDFDFDVESMTFVYGGNFGVFDIVARDAGNNIVDSFFQASTGNGQPAGPVTLSRGAGNPIRSIFWTDPGNNYSVIDNVEVVAATIDVDIDIKPGSFPNSINPKSKGLVPVAILGTATFDVTTVDVTTLRFGPAEAARAHDVAHLEDVNNDGFLDLVSHFRQKDTGLTLDDLFAELSGNLLDGTQILGTDSVRVLG